jgi:phosphopantothenoylcysteine decarboxylase
VRVNPRLPHEQDPLPDADAVVAAPLTFNTINKWAAGISDTLALGLLNELMGAGLPIYVVPCVKSALRNHPAYSASIALLRKSGVTVLDQDEITFKASSGLTAFDWSSIATALR